MDAPFCMQKADASLQRPDIIYCGLLINPESMVMVS